MPRRVRVTTEDGESVILTLEDEAPVAPASRIGLFTSPLAPEMARAQAAVEEAGHPGLTTSASGAYLKGLLSGMGSGALNVVEGATTPASLALQAATAGALRIPAVGALARTPISVPGLIRGVGRGLKSYDVTRPAKPIGDLLEWLATRPSPQPAPPVAGPPSGSLLRAPTPAVPSEADFPGGLLTETPQLATTPRRPNTINAAMEEAIAKHRAAQAATRPASEAVAVVRRAAGVAKLRLTAQEFQRATKLAQAGIAGDTIIETIVAERAAALGHSPSFAGLPSERDVAATVAKKNIGTRDRAARRMRELMAANPDKS